MRARVLPIALIALLVAGSAGAAPSGKPKLVRLVRRDGNVTAVLTYRANFTHVTVSLSEHARVVLRHRVCPLDGWGRECMFANFAFRSRPGFRNVAANRTPAFVTDLYTGGAHCCVQTFIALGGVHPAWIAHDWKNPGYVGKRIAGRYYYVSGDDRFAYAFTSYAGSWFPSQIWTVRGGRLVNVTRSEQRLVESNARHAWHWYLKGRRDHTERGVGILAGWCADKYLLRQGARCQRALSYALRHGYLKREVGPPGRAFIRELNRDLVRWGYARSAMR